MKDFKVTVSRCLCGWFAVGLHTHCEDCGLDLAALTQMCDEMIAIHEEVEAMEWPDIILVD